MINILGFASHMFSVAAAGVCYYGIIAVIDSTYANWCGCVPVKLYLINRHAVAC
jgi:hypothetical protein